MFGSEAQTDILQKLQKIQSHVNALKEGIGTQISQTSHMDILNKQQTIIGGGSDPLEILDRFYSLGPHSKEIEDSLESISGHYVIIPNEEFPANLIQNVYPMLDPIKTEDKTLISERNEYKKYFNEIGLETEASFLETIKDYNQNCSDAEKIFESAGQTIKNQKFIQVDESSPEKEEDYLKKVDWVFSGITKGYFCDECHKNLLSTSERQKIYDHIINCKDSDKCADRNMHMQPGCPNKSCYNNLLYIPPVSISNKEEIPV